MITVPGYIVMGEDGKEYGPSTSAEIRQWVAEGRMDKKSPVKHTDENGDWMFLETIPEFAKAFEKVAQAPLLLPKSPPRKGLVRIFLVVVVLAELVFIVLKMMEALPVAGKG